MAKGLDKHRERLDRLSSFGKDLARRSGRRCELCGASGVSLSIYEVGPVPADPSFDQCIFVCDTCRSQLEKPRSLDANHWRCANESVWSDVPAVQVIAARVLDCLGREELWAREALEAVDFEEEVDEWIRQEPL